jgi:hypothetical protein
MPVVHKIDDALEISYKPFLGMIGLTYLLYIITYFGLLSINTQYIELLNIITQLFICIFLLVRFNPFREHELRKYDAKIIFGSGVLLSMNLLGHIGFRYITF